jgi:hypothetical protein
MLLLDAAGKPVAARKLVDLAEDPQRYRIRRALEQGRLRFDPRRLFA